MEKHCEKCSYETSEGLAISGCDFCGCHNPKNLMKNLRTIEDVLKEFEKRFVENKREDGEDYTLYLRDNDIKSFISSSVRELLEQVVPEDKRDDVNKGGGQYGHPETDFDTGFNACRQEIEDRIKHILNN